MAFRALGAKQRYRSGFIRSSNHAAAAAFRRVKASQAFTPSFPRMGVSPNLCVSRQDQ
jgi:hypothetical protein